MAHNEGGHPRMTAEHPGGSSGHSAEQMMDKAREAAGQMKEKAQDYASGLASHAQEKWNDAREGLRGGYDQMSHRAEDLWRDATDFIRRYPVASIAVAFGVGCLASCAWFAVQGGRDDMTERMSRSSS